MRSMERLFSQPVTHATLFEDRVYGHDDWTKHRNAAWRHRIEPVVFARVAVGFGWQLLLVFLVSIAVGLIHTFVPGHEKVLAGTHLTTPFTMITFALSLLLVFKTNSSYSRWWEGRIIWGQIVNFGRNYTRQALMWFPHERPELRAAAVRWAAAAPRVLLAHIREGCDLAAEVGSTLEPEEVEWLSGWSNAPLGAGSALGQLVVAAGLRPELQAELQRQVELYTNMAGGCERIFKTPIPPAYTRHTSRFLMLYVVTSPVLLWSATGWATPVVAVIIAFLLLGVENIGVQVEEPFHVLPLYDICRALEGNIRELERNFLWPASSAGGGMGGGEGGGGGRPRPPGQLPLFSSVAGTGTGASSSWGLRSTGTGTGTGTGSGAGSDYQAHGEGGGGVDGGGGAGGGGGGGAASDIAVHVLAGDAGGNALAQASRRKSMPERVTHSGAALALGLGAVSTSSAVNGGGAGHVGGHGPFAGAGLAAAAAAGRPLAMAAIQMPMLAPVQAPSPAVIRPQAP
ncbi:hypothetical protein HYH02_009024 [Chlamydomonas schloesseri]|uniref:Uncharacterized protein n=1 Tax=Chlamydomonas schloesseri TaxID=2026947 RepID=A0A836B0Q2_9CHLO|nr:hypothetical protein HYH02_009024 [Chlamydomonas schloesseri]|eukprot:KAG2444082.1 hypothetical protein HYH02_009024 [Chlamydomonas schloesseri]